MAVQWEYRVGPLTLNFRVLLEPKGFLRIIMVIISILAFSLTAGFTDGANDNSLSCVSRDNVTRELSLQFSYPFTAQEFRASYSPFDEFLQNRTANVSSCRTTDGFDTRSFAGFAQFFVAVGVLSFLYCLGILFVYVIFVNPQLPFAKWLLVFDFVAGIVFALFYLLADILWSAGIAGMDTYIDTELLRRGNDCLDCDRGQETRPGIFAQPAISVVFGWLLCVVWIASLWFSFKDTHWHGDKTGPLSETYAPDGQSGNDTPGPPPG